MSLEDDLVRTILAQLTSAERAGAVVYLKDTSVPAGSSLEFPRISIEVPWEARVVFVDRDPMANWSHACRYMLVDPERGEVQSHEAQLPPFRPGQGEHWRVIYKAPSVPQSAVYDNP